MACDSQAGLEAQKLISISLGKMAASRVGRTGTSLHKSLLVASVLHRARHVFLEESYHVHRVAHPEACPSQTLQAPVAVPASPPPVVAVYTPLLPPTATTTAESPVEGSVLVDSEDKENHTHEQQQEEEQVQQAGESTTTTLRTPLGESNGSVMNKTRQTTLKRRRCVTQQETQEAVWSILPKRPRTCHPEDTTTTISTDQEQHQQEEDEVQFENSLSSSSSSSSSMEVEHITSLVSIFSFGGQRVDLCGAEAAREDVAQFHPVALAV